jgi:hypothetical protein
MHIVEDYTGQSSWLTRSGQVRPDLYSAGRVSTRDGNRQHSADRFGKAVGLRVADPLHGFMSNQEVING